MYFHKELKSKCWKKKSKINDYNRLWLIRKDEKSIITDKKNYWFLQPLIQFKTFSPLPNHFKYSRAISRCVYFCTSVNVCSNLVTTTHLFFFFFFFKHMFSKIRWTVVHGIPISASISLTITPCFSSSTVATSIAIDRCRETTRPQAVHCAHVYATIEQYFCPLLHFHEPLSTKHDWQELYCYTKFWFWMNIVWTS